MSAHSIAWYRDFYDVPRLFAIAAAGGCLLFDCRFDSARDEYSDRYAVTFVPLPPTEADAIIEAATSRAPRVSVSVAALTFDPSRRAAVDVPDDLQ